MTEAPPIEARSVSRTYRGVRVVDDVDLLAGAGEIVGLAGPSGSGKSTLLRLLAGLERPDAGTIHWGDRTDRPPPAWVMPVFQDPLSSLDRRWPVWRSVTEPLLARHRRPAPSSARRRELAVERFADVGLEGLDPDRRPSELSGGQCQRLALLRAVVAAPRVLLADEPTSALDASVTAGILRLLVDIAGSGVAVIAVSHDRVALGAIADRIVPIRALTSPPGAGDHHLPSRRQHQEEVPQP